MICPRRPANPGARHCTSDPTSSHHRGFAPVGQASSQRRPLRRVAAPLSPPQRRSAARLMTVAPLDSPLDSALTVSKSRDNFVCQVHTSARRVITNVATCRAIAASSRAPRARGESTSRPRDATRRDSTRLDSPRRRCSRRIPGSRRDASSMWCWPRARRALAGALGRLSGRQADAEQRPCACRCWGIAPPRARAFSRRARARAPAWLRAQDGLAGPCGGSGWRWRETAPSRRRASASAARGHAGDPALCVGRRARGGGCPGMPVRRA